MSGLVDHPTILYTLKFYKKVLQNLLNFLRRSRFPTIEIPNARYTLSNSAVTFVAYEIFETLGTFEDDRETFASFVLSNRIRSDSDLSLRMYLQCRFVTIQSVLNPIVADRTDRKPDKREKKVVIEGHWRNQSRLVSRVKDLINVLAMKTRRSGRTVTTSSPRHSFVFAC